MDTSEGREAVMMARPLGLSDNASVIRACLNRAKGLLSPAPLIPRVSPGDGCVGYSDRAVSGGMT